MLSDLRDSGAIEEDADNVLLLYREGYYNATADNTAELCIAKQRHGATCIVEIAWVREQQSFRDLSHHQN